MRLLAVALQVAVQAVDDEGVVVDGHHRAGAGLQGEAREAAVVGADVEHGAPGDRRGRGGDEALLGRQVGGGVVRAVGVVGPRRLLALPGEPGDHPLEPAQLGVDEARPEAGLLELGADVAIPVGVGVAPLGPGEQADVEEDVPVQAGRPVEHRRGDLGLDAVDRPAQERLERDVAQRRHQQRVQEQLAELAVPRPRLARAEPFERADVDEDGAGADELDVVGRGVLRQHLLGERLPGQSQLEQGGVAEHGERPLVRVGHDRDTLVAQHAGPAVAEDGPVLVQLGAHDVAGGQGAGEEVGGGEGQVVVVRFLREPAPHDVTVEVDARQRVAERPRIGAAFGHGVVAALASASARRRRRRRRRQRRARSASAVTFSTRSPSSCELRFVGLRPVLLGDDPHDAVAVHLEHDGHPGTATSETARSICPVAPSR